MQLPSEDSERLLIITFSPLCSICRQNLSGWKRLAVALQGHEFRRLVWVSRNSAEATRGYCEEQHLPIRDVLSDPSHRTYLQLGLETVPNVIAVERGGIAKRVWAGALNQRMWREIADYVGLPQESLLDSNMLGADLER